MSKVDVLKEIKRIQHIRKALEENINILVSMPVGQIEEAEEDKLFKELNDKIAQAREAEWDAKIECIRLNDWSKQYFSSFPECESRKISIKQADIFEKNLPHVETKHNTSTFHSKHYASCSVYAGNYEDEIYQVSIFRDCGYLTKRKAITI